MTTGYDKKKKTEGSNVLEGTNVIKSLGDGVRGPNGATVEFFEKKTR